MNKENLRREFEAWKSRQPTIVDDADLNYLGKFVHSKLSVVENILSKAENNDEIDKLKLQIRNVRKIMNSIQNLMNEHSQDFTHEKRKEELSKLKLEKAQIRVNTYPKNPIFLYLMTLGIGIIPTTTGILALSFDRVLSNFWILIPFILSYGIGIILISIGISLQYRDEKNKFKLYQDAFGFGDHRNPYLQRKIKKMIKEKVKTKT